MSAPDDLDPGAPRPRPGDPAREPPDVSDRQRAGWGPAGQPTYDRRVEQRRQAGGDAPDPDRRETPRRADDRWQLDRRAAGLDMEPAPLRPSSVGAGASNGEAAAGAGRLLAVLLVAILAFAGGIAVDQAAWRGTATVPPVAVTPGPGPTGVVRPPATARPGASAEPGSSGEPSAAGSTAPPATAVPGTPGTPAPTPRATPGPTIGPGATVPPFAPANIGILWDVLKIVDDHFVRRAQLNPTDLGYGAINGLVDALGDPGHTTFLTPDQVKSENEALSGQIIGIGVYLGVTGGAPFIQSVISGSPAARAGILPGDRIIAIDGTSAENLSTEEIARLIRGTEGTQVTLTVIHAHGNSPLNVTVTREKITVPAVTWVMLPGTQFADIRINEFSAGTTEQFVTAIRGARQAGARGIVLDLRNNPGGYVDEAVGVASQFLASGNVYIRRTADGTEIPVPVKSGGIATSMPLAVLIDYGSASSAEITAGALQDAHRGPLIGTRTYGTGTVLNTFDLPDGSAVRVGVEEWLTPSGHAIFPNGIQPDQEVDLVGDTPPLEPDTIRAMTGDELQASADVQLLRAIADLAGR